MPNQTSNSIVRNHLIGTTLISAFVCCLLSMAFYFKFRHEIVKSKASVFQTSGMIDQQEGSLWTVTDIDRTDGKEVKRILERGCTWKDVPLFVDRKRQKAGFLMIITFMTSYENGQFIKGPSVVIDSNTDFKNPAARQQIRFSHEIESFVEQKHNDTDNTHSVYLTAFIENLPIRGIGVDGKDVFITSRPKCLTYSYYIFEKED